ncbi:hypothetical protein L1987_30772 [Smallanthus sonchifolius]|uniref:Uncharacterized protein n=1 Tax=Smallanthus sonchifolius TaxID=185202 RepID=A0ACB9I6E7_9ASTR|nr:hypothetical protein L1987_30772 [Smallanthus sonchifolius]
MQNQQWMCGAYNPCIETYSNQYFNLPEVQKAFHANITSLSYTWKTCSHVVGGGDTDAIVPLTVTRYSIGALNLSAIANWYPRYDNGKVIRSVKQKELGTQIDHLNKKMAQAFVYA